MSKRWIAGSLKVALTMILATGIATTAMAEEIKIGAGAAPTENVFNKIQDPLKAATGVSIKIISNGPSQALKELDNGAIDAAAGGLTFQDWMSMMDKEGYAMPDKGAYKSRVIGKDVIKVLTNKDVTVTSLTKEQLTAIFTGKTKNWKEVGGPDKPIVILLGSKIPGTQAVFQKQILAGADYTKEAVEGTTAPDLKEKVIATSGAVCLGPMSVVDDTINAPEIPEVGRPITIITKGEPSGGVKTLLDFIRGEGQKYIGK
ncbi:MAG: substrate-binding domain-containing protein [Proteobacteria bacterium]|nr:phosphate ABC transporter substrate-binding protein [Desulfobulbaceae bacterium]MBU4151358.1 substrate-binding domain-containing protein [Pseudomonadota bacterium]MDP2107377.1 substrate-binding domain-containing protein [Desulfobulbaceae bacterium]